MPKFKRLDLINQNENIDFLRVGSPKYILELSGKTNRVVFYADEIWEDRQTGHYFSKSFELDPKQVTEIEQLIDSLDILSIPSDRFIKGWSSGFDGITYFIEEKKDHQYSFKTYWTPSAQPDLKEAKTLSDFADKRLDRIIDYEGKRKLFEQEISFYGWTYNGSIMTTKVIADRKAFRKYKREKKKQLKTVDIQEKNKSKTRMNKYLLNYIR
ncbi:MAG TPA: hypothetical protein VN040_20670 [Pseudosphingobacterium sp.]|nr:hypothetical protein [Pseudosphingobacterium sp.]